jgi:murein tripeptide amidase MpaA
MIADFFTKPLQGALFQKFRDQIMNINPLPNGPQDCRSVLGKTDARVTPDANTDGEDDGWTVVRNKRKNQGLSRTCLVNKKFASNEVNMNG